MNAIVNIPQNFGAVSSRFAGIPIDNDLAEGINSGYAIVGYKGKVWSVRKGGESRDLMRPDGDGPMNSIEVVVVRAPSVISKIFYENGYVEGSTASPDCYSTNGQVPAAGAVKKQHTVCVTCPKNAWGSRITAGGKNGKACSDSKRLAIVPLQDLRNEADGGPMLLRVPAASLTDMAAFAKQMAKIGWPYMSFGMRIAFDPKESYPKFAFSAIRPLTDAEAAIVLELHNSPDAIRILADDEVQPEQAAQPEQVFEQPAQQGQQGIVTSHGNAQANGGTQSSTQQNNHTTGAASTQSAPTAGQNGSTQTTHAPQGTANGASTGSAPTTNAGTAAPAPTGSTPTSTQDQAQEQQPTGLVDFDAQLDALLGDS